MSDREYEANDIALTLSTDRETYDKAIKPTILNLARKMVNKTYKKDVSLKAWLNVVEWGLKNTMWYKKNAIKPSLQTRKLAAKYLGEEWEAELKDDAKNMIKLKKEGKSWSMQGR